MKIINVFDALQRGTFEDFLNFYDGDIDQVNEYSYLNLLQNVMVEGELPEEKLKMITYLLDAGIDVNFIDKKGQMNALHVFYYTVWRPDKDYLLKATKLLVEHGIDINAKDRNGAIPLRYVMTANRLEDEEDLIELYRYHLEHGAKYRDADAYGKSCFDYAEEYSWRNKFLDTVKEYEEKHGN